MRTGFLLLATALSLHGEMLTISTNSFHLGRSGQPEWEEFRGRAPIGEKLQLTFRGSPNAVEQVLYVRQDDVKQEWTVALNGMRLGLLFQMEEDLVHMLRVPPNAIRAGENVLEITGRALDDIVIRELRIGRPDYLPVQVRVTENGVNIPARITFVTREGALAPLKKAEASPIAVRPGVAYTASGEAELLVIPGDYTLFATRGPEYSVAERQITVAAGMEKVELEIGRVVDTRGWAAADTHIHTFTFSRHGDATLDERVITIAGEAVELPVSTDHNQHADYAPAVRKARLEEYFTLIPGNEVTTRKGHFNIFPVDHSSPPPDSKIEHWPELIRQMRQTPRVDTIIINHPTDIHSGFLPFARTNLNYATGANLGPLSSFAFDGMELINSSAMNTDWMAPFRAWFALLNRGHRITGIGSSDSHDVSRFIVGQGRTYVRVNDSNPGKIDVAAACNAIRTGQAVVSLGLFTTVQIDDRAGPGEQHQPVGDTISIRVQVDSPNWITASRVALFANGNLVREEALQPTAGIKRIRWELPRPYQDTWYVVLASGPGVDAPYWGMARPYQPSSPVWTPVSLGATNPVYVDADRDGSFESPRAVAERLLARSESPGNLMISLAPFDSATAAQAAEFLAARGVDLRAPIDQPLPQHVLHGFKSYLEAAGL